MNRLTPIFKNFVFWPVILFFLSGCIGRFWGSYVGQPKEGEKGSYSQSFDCSYEVCFQETQAILQELGATIFSKNKKKGFISATHFGRVYRNYVDTTEVGIFFKKIEPDKTEIEVACGNYDLAEAVAKNIFLELGKKY